MGCSMFFTLESRSVAQVFEEVFVLPWCMNYTVPITQVSHSVESKDKLYHRSIPNISESYSFSGNTTQRYVLGLIHLIMMS